MMEAAREQVEPTRARRTRFLHWLGFHWVLPHPAMIRAATLVQPVVRPFLPRRVRAMIPTRSSPFATLPASPIRLPGSPGVGPWPCSRAACRTGGSTG